MKVCHINLSRRFSGSERQTLQLIKQQLREGYKLTIVARHNSAFEKEVEKLPCKLVTTRSCFIKQSAKLNKQCELFHAHDQQGAQWAYMQNLKHSSPYIITHRNNKELVNKYFSTKTYQNAQALVGLSTSIVKNLTAKFSDKDCIKIPSSPVSYPVNQNKVDQIWSSHAYKFLVLHATSLETHKGFDVTINAARILQEKNSPIHFLLLGSGPQEVDLRKQAEGLTNVFFMSKQQDMGTWFASANLLVHPSYKEGLGSVILEAIAAGLPVIASNTGGIPDIIEHEKTGLLIEPGNAQELSDAIERLSNDQELREQLQTNAKEILPAFEITQTSKRYHDLYMQVITEKQSV
ncbi:MAG: glycosyltransferase involved in cell wall biosynthesis [Oleiphilaceae bacterium]|jgi:glycosyltransferase involved in cell wall biosynthesis